MDSILIALLAISVVVVIILLTRKQTTTPPTPTPTPSPTPTPPPTPSPTPTPPPPTPPPTPTPTPPPTSKISFPMTYHEDNVIGSQYFTDVEISGNVYNVLVDTGSMSMNLQKYKKTGVKNSKPNKFVVYGGKQITPEQCQSSQNDDSVYSECAMIEWWNDKFNAVKTLQVGSVMYGGIPSIFGLSQTFDKSQGTFIWGDNPDLKNLTLDFANGIFTINDDDTDHYDMVPRVPVSNVSSTTNNMYSVAPLQLTIGGKQLDTSKYLIVIDNGTPTALLPNDILQQMDSDSLNVKISETTSFNVSGGQSIGNAPIIIIGNQYYRDKKIYLDQDYVGFKTPNHIPLRLTSTLHDRRGMLDNIDKLRKLGSKWQQIKYGL